MGIFAKTFVRPALPEVLDAVAGHGLECLQFNFACAGLPSLPESIPPGLTEKIRAAMAARGLTMAGVSGTCNLIHPDPARRENDLKHLKTLIAAAPALGAPLVTLCTGTRDPDNMWRHHPDNRRPEAWRDLRHALGRILETAEDHRVTLGVEPECANVVHSAERACQLLHEMRSARLKIVLDPANLLTPASLPRQKSIVEQAVDILGEDLVMAHAKELGPDGQPSGGLAAGRGRVDWAFYLRQLREAGFAGPLILHGCEEPAVAESVDFLRRHLLRP